MKQKLFFIRHGHTTGTADGYMYGATDLPLTEDGMKEIGEFAKQGLYPEPRASVVYISGMLRTKQTLDEIYGEVPYLEAPALREINMGEMEMTPLDELLADQWTRDWLLGRMPDVPAPGGESFAGFTQRVVDGVHEIISENIKKGQDSIIVICHGGVISTAMTDLFPEDEKKDWDWTPHPGGGFEIDIENGKARAYKFIGLNELEGDMSKQIETLKA